MNIDEMAYHMCISRGSAFKITHDVSFCSMTSINILSSTPPAIHNLGFKVFEHSAYCPDPTLQEYDRFIYLTCFGGVSICQCKWLATQLKTGYLKACGTIDQNVLKIWATTLKIIEFSIVPVKLFIN